MRRMEYRPTTHISEAKLCTKYLLGKLHTDTTLNKIIKLRRNLQIHCIIQTEGGKNLIHINHWHNLPLLW
jgi:hypothetical protein